MKTFFLSALILLTITASAQTKHKHTNKQTTKKTIVKQTNKKTSNRNTVQLNTTSSNSAFDESANTTRFTIADPVTNTLNAKANGADIDVGKSGIMGMPKRAFGFANGHLTLKPNSATSIGTINGSGSVGTGTFPGSVGTGSMIPGVNGKNPYAGVDSWGTHLTGAGIQIKEQATNIDKRKQ